MMSHDLRAPLPRLFAAAVMLAALAHCSSDRSLSGNQAAPGSTGSVSVPVDMSGRWVFSSASGGKCGMNFGADTGSREGTIAPEGGCPDRFFTSRKWALEQGTLLIRDHNGRPLAQLTAAAPDRFDGRSATGPAVTLSRPLPTN